MTENKMSNILIPKHKLFSKFPLPQRRYSELDLFRQQEMEGEPCPHHRPYSSKKRSVAAYRLIFLTFALLFGVLAVTTLSVSSTLSYGFFSLPTTFKGLVITLCILLSLASFLLGITLRTEREATIHTLHHWSRKLKTYYYRKKINLFGPHKHHIKQLKQTYREIREKMHEKKEETLHLLAKISSASLPKEEREKLLNQAIAELHERLKFLAQQFRDF